MNSYWVAQKLRYTSTRQTGVTSQESIELIKCGQLNVNEGDNYAYYSDVTSGSNSLFVIPISV